MNAEEILELCVGKHDSGGPPLYCYGCVMRAIKAAESEAYERAAKVVEKWQGRLGYGPVTAAIEIRALARGEK